MIEMPLNVLDAAQSAWTEPLRIYKEATESGELNDKPGKTKLAMAGASAMSVPRIFGSLLKSTIVDVPLAVTEGLRETPKLYGEKVVQHDPIVDWKTGAIAAGKVKSFCFGESSSTD